MQCNKDIYIQGSMGRYRKCIRDAVEGTETCKQHSKDGYKKKESKKKSIGQIYHTGFLEMKNQLRIRNEFILEIRSRLKLGEELQDFIDEFIEKHKIGD